MKRKKKALLIAIYTVFACNGTPRSQQRIDEDIRTFTMAVQHRSDEPAELCHRAIAPVAIASANISAAIARKESVPATRYAELDKADRIMRSACTQFR